MVERVRLTDEQKESNNQNIAKIGELTNQIKEIAVNLFGTSCREAYENSVKNLEVKNEKYTSKPSFQVSDEEKELLRKIRAGEIAIPEKENDEVSANVEKPMRKGKHGN